MAHCLSLSLTTHVMISYSYGFLGLGDKFNCVCGQEGVLEEVKMVETEKCDQPCPVGGLQCGQPAKDLMRYVHIPWLRIVGVFHALEAVRWHGVGGDTAARP